MAKTPLPASRQFTLTATLFPCPEGGFTAVCPEISGAISEGDSEAEAMENLRDAVEGVLIVNAEMTARRLKSPSGKAARRPLKRTLMELCEAR